MFIFLKLACKITLKSIEINEISKIAKKNAAQQ